MSFRPLLAPRTDVLRPPQDTISARLAKLAWRYRRQLSPIAAVGTLALGSEIGHLASAGYAWLPLAVGLAGAAAWRLWAHRPIHHWYALGAGVAGAWSAACWLVGLGDPIVQGSLVVLGTGACGVWIAHHVPRGKVVIIGGSRRPWEREAFVFERRHRAYLQRIVRAWPEIAAEAKVPGTTVRRAEADIATSTYRLLLELRALTAMDLRKQVDRVAVGLQARRWAVTVADHDSHAHLAWLSWHREDSAPGLPAARVEAPEAVEEETEDDPRLALLLRALDETPRPGREVAKLAGLEYDDWLWRVGLQELAQRGQAEKTAGGWRRPERAAKEA